MPLRSKLRIGAMNEDDYTEEELDELDQAIERVNSGDFLTVEELKELLRSMDEEIQEQRDQE